MSLVRSSSESIFWKPLVEFLAHDITEITLRAIASVVFDRSGVHLMCGSSR